MTALKFEPESAGLCQEYYVYYFYYTKITSSLLSCHVLQPHWICLWGLKFMQLRETKTLCPQSLHLNTGRFQGVSIGGIVPHFAFPVLKFSWLGWSAICNQTHICGTIGPCQIQRKSAFSPLTVSCGKWKEPGWELENLVLSGISLLLEQPTLSQKVHWGDEL